MRIAAAISASLHIAVFLLAWFGALPSSRPLVAPAQVIDVEIATDLPARAPVQQVKPTPKPKPAPPPPPPPPKRAAPPPPPEPQVAEKQEPEPVAVPVPKPKTEPKPVPKPEPKVEKPPEPKPTPKKAAAKPLPRPREKPKPPPKYDFASVLKTVEKLEKQAPAKPEPKPEKKATVSPFQQIAEALKKRQSEPRKRPSPAQESLSSREYNALRELIRQQIEPCWNIPAGARDAENMVVEIRATVAPDGRVSSAHIVDQARARRDGFYRSMAESAVRAILNPRCQPLPLPLDKYDEWRDLVFSFNPREMF